MVCERSVLLEELKRSFEDVRRKRIAYRRLLATANRRSPIIIRNPNLGWLITNRLLVRGGPFQSELSDEARRRDLSSGSLDLQEKLGYENDISQFDQEDPRTSLSSSRKT